MMPLYRRLPLEFEAVRWDSRPETHHLVERWARASGQNIRVDGRNGIVLFTTPDGGDGCKVGDYLVRGIDGEVYSIPARRFARLYEPVTVVVQVDGAGATTR